MFFFYFFSRCLRIEILYHLLLFKNRKYDLRDFLCCCCCNFLYCVAKFDMKIEGKDFFFFIFWSFLCFYLKRSVDSLLTSSIFLMCLSPNLFLTDLIYLCDLTFNLYVFKSCYETIYLLKDCFLWKFFAADIKKIVIATDFLSKLI